MFKFKFFTIIFIFLYLNVAFSNEIKIQERINNFKNSKESIRKISQNVRNKNYSYINNDILFLYSWFKVMPSYFPKGSEASINNNSDASAEIWENFSLFQKFSDNAMKISLQMINSINKNNLEDLDNMLNELSRTCSSCHKRFRN